MRRCTSVLRCTSARPRNNSMAHGMRALGWDVSGVPLRMLNRRAFLNDLARHETYLYSHLREISKRCRISSVLIGEIIAGRRTWMDASDAELDKVASYIEKNDTAIDLD
jgi:hypothetical protein